MSQAISQENLVSVLEILKQDQTLKDRLSAEGDSETLIEEIAEKAGVKLKSKNLVLGSRDDDLSDQELEDIAPQAGTKKCNFECGDLLTIRN